MLRIQNQDTIKRLPVKYSRNNQKNCAVALYQIDETMKEKFSDKNTEDSLEKELKYCKQRY